MSECTHNCNSCAESCSSRSTPQKAPFNELSSVRRTVAVISGKGGVGKSTVTVLLAILARRMGLRVGILDADITGPSIPRALGVSGRVEESPDGLYPLCSKTGIEVMSVNLLLPEETTPVVWRGPVVAGTVRQFFTNVVWDDLDVLLIDCPPGTGDVPLTVLGELPIDAAVAVTAPQGLVNSVVEKSLRMAQKLNIPIAGIVENLSAYICPDCGKTHPLFGDGSTAALAERYCVPQVAKLPIHPKLAAASDKGMCELFEGDWLDALAEELFGGLL